MRNQECSRRPNGPQLAADISLCQRSRSATCPERVTVPISKVPRQVRQLQVSPVESRGQRPGLQLVKGAPVHRLGSNLGKPIEEAQTTAQPHPELPRFPCTAIPRALALACVG
jgi:hypothetical protein